MGTFEAVEACATELEDDECFVVVFVEHTDGSGARLELQRALEFDEQDERLGQDTYCLCTEDGATSYGGVASWQLSGHSLDIVLNDKAAERLGHDGFVVKLPAKLATEEAARHVLRDGIRRLLAAPELEVQQPS